MKTVQQSVTSYDSPYDSTVQLERIKLLDGLRAAGLAFEVSEEESLWRFTRIWTTNSFAVEGGSALYLTLSRANHSCKPNVLRAELPDGDIALVAVAPIQSGDELCLSYIRDMNQLLPRALRQATLKTWFPSCECPRCSDTADDMRSAACFQTDGCSGVRCFAGGRLQACSRCGDRFGPEEEELLGKEEEKLAEVYHALESNPLRVGMDGGVALRQCTSRVSALFASSHWLCGRFHDMLRDLEEQLGNFRAARLHAQGVLDCYDAHLRRPSVMRAFNREHLARIEKALGNRFEAYKQQLAALRELASITPPEHSFCRDARRSLQAVLESA